MRGGGKLERVIVKQRSVLPLVLVVESRMAWTFFSDVGAVNDGVGRLNFIFAVLCKKIVSKDCEDPAVVLWSYWAGIAWYKNLELTTELRIWWKQKRKRYQMRFDVEIKSDTAHADQLDGDRFISHRSMYQIFTGEYTVRENDWSECVRKLALCIDTMLNRKKEESVQLIFNCLIKARIKTKIYKTPLDCRLDRFVSGLKIRCP